MLRDLVSVSACLAAFCLFAGCGGGGGEPDPTGYEADGFEVDDTRDLAKEQPVNGPPQYRTLWPAGDEDFIRFRVNEVDPDGADEDGPHYLVTYPYYTAAVRSEWWNDLGRIELGVDPCYRQSDGGFTEPGIYYVKLFDDDAAGGACQTWITLQRDGDACDLVARAMNVPMEVTSGEETTFRVWLVNQGGATAFEGFDVSLYLSADGVTPVGGAIAEEEVTYDLLGGYSYDLPITVTSFPATLDGPVYLIAEVDTNSEVNEVSYESNNLFVGSTLVDPATYSAALPAPTPIVPTAGTPTVTLAGRILYPADDPDTTAVDESDVDEFELQLDVGLSYYEIWTEKLVGWADPKVKIVDGAGGNPLDPPVEAEDGGLGNGASYLCYDSGAASGSVWIRVTDEHGNSGGYDLVVRASAGPLGGPDRFEPDGGVGTWRVLREGDPGMFDGRSFSTAGDEDWVAYPVSVANASRKHTIMTYDLSSSPACQTKLEIYRSGATTALYTDETAGGAVLTDLVLAAGLYYVRVTNTDTEAGGTYLLRADITD